MKEVTVKVKLAEEGFLPSFTRDGDVCTDCKACIKEDVVIRPSERTQIPLGFALGLPKGWEAQIRPRSGLSKRGIDVTLGSGDQNFTGFYQATVINNTKEDFIVHRGDRLCQMAIREIPDVSFVLVEELEETNRGEAGWGSSGI